MLMDLSLDIRSTAYYFTYYPTVTTIDSSITSHSESIGSFSIVRTPIT
jgi:hypothetical protein